MERSPHKSTWKRKKKVEMEPSKEVKHPKAEPDLIETLNKIKKYTLALIIVIAALLCVAFFYPSTQFLF